MTHTEKVHIFFGVGLLLIGGLALHGTARPRSFTRSAWPLLTVLLGFMLFVPVEARTRTYESVGWWQTLFSWIPQEPGVWVKSWIDAVGSIHAIQHKIGGMLAMLGGVVELHVARRSPDPGRMAELTSLLTMSVGVAFGVHGGTAEHLPSLREQIHHWVLGAALVSAGVLLLLHQRGVLSRSIWRFAWPVLIALAGLDLVVFYRLAGSEHGGH